MSFHDIFALSQKFNQNTEPFNLFDCHWLCCMNMAYTKTQLMLIAIYLNKSQKDRIKRQGQLIPRH